MSTSTPWGPSQEQTTIAPGIVRHSTAGHGGIMLSDERLAAMPAPLREFSTWAGRGAYEEDRDAALVVLAFPWVFPPAAVSSAVDAVTSELGRSYFGAGVLAWLDTEAGKTVRTIGDTWRNSVLHRYRVCVSGSTPRRHEQKAEQLRLSTGMRLNWAMLSRISDGRRVEAFLTDVELYGQPTVDVDSVPAERVLSTDTAEVQA